MRKTERELKRPGANAQLGADSDVARPCAVVKVGHLAVGVMELDVHVRAAEVASRRAAERTHDAYPHVLLAHDQRGRMGVEHLGEVPLGAGRPVCRRLHVEANVGQLRREGAGDYQCILIGIGDEILGQPVFVVSAFDRERGDSRREPGDLVLSVTRIVDRRRSTGRREEPQLMQDDALKRRIENLAEAAVGKREPDLASGTRGRAESQLASRAPHRRRAGATWCLHRALSMDRRYDG